MKKLTLILFSTWTTLICFGQLSGTVLDSEKKEPLAFVNIGVLGKSIGTVTDYSGRFHLDLSKSELYDTLVISMLGYERLMLTVNEFRIGYPTNPVVIHLEPKSYEKNEVVITPRKLSPKILGNTVSRPMVSMGFSSNDLGSEIGVRMNVKKKQRCFVDSLFFNVAECTYDSVLFRVNMHTLHKGVPSDSSLLKEPLYLTLYAKTGTLKVDVRDLNISADEDFFVSLEWLQDLGEGRLTFPASFTNTSSLVRNASQGHWQKLPAGVGFYCKTRIENKPKRKSK